MLVIPPVLSVDSSLTSRTPTIKKCIDTAIVYCEGNFGAIDGKTANGLIRRSERYKILSVIDSEKAGLDTGMVLDNKANAIPVCRNMADSLEQAGSVPDAFIFGMAPSSGMLSKHERGIVLAPCHRYEKQKVFSFTKPSIARTETRPWPHRCWA